jgi:hypothetical protein
MMTATRQLALGGTGPRTSTDEGFPAPCAGAEYRHAEKQLSSLWGAVILAVL